VRTTILFVNLFSGSIMVGGFASGLATVARAHRSMPPSAAWEFHRFISRGVDWFIPTAAITATATGWLLLLVGERPGGAARTLTLLGALLVTSYGLPFLVHPTGLRNELGFLAHHHGDEGGMVRRMGWWNRWHVFRTLVGFAAHACFIAAALAR
jgi:hypothetical protein